MFADFLSSAMRNLTPYRSICARLVQMSPGSFCLLAYFILTVPVRPFTLQFANGSSVQFMRWEHAFKTKVRPVNHLAQSCARMTRAVRGLLTDCSASISRETRLPAAESRRGMSDMCHAASTSHVQCEWDVTAATRSYYMMTYIYSFIHQNVHWQRT